MNIMNMNEHEHDIWPKNHTCTVLYMYAPVGGARRGKTSIVFQAFYPAALPSTAHTASPLGDARRHRPSYGNTRWHDSCELCDCACVTLLRVPALAKRPMLQILYSRTARKLYKNRLCNFAGRAVSWICALSCLSDHHGRCCHQLLLCVAATTADSNRSASLVTDHILAEEALVESKTTSTTPAEQQEMAPRRKSDQ